MKTKYIVGSLGLLALLGVGIAVVANRKEDNGITITPGTDAPGSQGTEAPHGIPVDQIVQVMPGSPTYWAPSIDMHPHTQNTNSNIGCLINPDLNSIM